MSDAEKSPLDLTGLDFGPSWAKDKTPARDYSKEVGPRENRDRRGKGPRREGGGRSNDRRQGGNDRRQGGNDRRQNNDRREQGGDRRQNDRRGGDRRNQHREPRIEVPAPEGFNGGVMPVEEGLDNLSKEIQGGGRTYSVFDLARVVMGARERFNVTFEAPKGSKFFRCKSDGSLWLTKEEAVSHFWQAKLLPELYEEIESEAEAPKGNFTSVAKCGLSGQWLAPPNYHSYPGAVARMHAERFAHMSLEDYKRKIRVESGEEVVAAWIESQTKKIEFRPLSSKEILALREARKKAEDDAKAEKKKQTTDEPKEQNEGGPDQPTAEPAALAKEPAPEATQEEATHPPASSEATVAEAAEEASAAEGAVANEEPVASEDAASEAATESEAPASEAASEEPLPKEEKAVELLADRREVERHFADHHFKHIFAQVDRAWVPGNVSAKLLSPALLTLLKATVADERRYPSKLTPILCRQLSGRHLAVFKWNKKLKAGPARPHAVPEDIQLAERPQQMLVWITANSGKNLEELWKGVLPADADKKTKQNYYHDLHWLLNQGFILLMADSTLHLAKTKPVPQPKKEKAAEASTEPTPEAAAESTPDATEKTLETTAEVPEGSEPKATEKVPEAQAPKAEAAAVETPAAEAPAPKTPAAEAPQIEPTQKEELAPEADKTESAE